MGRGKQREKPKSRKRTKRETKKDTPPAPGSGSRHAAVPAEVDAGSGTDAASVHSLEDSVEIVRIVPKDERRKPAARQSPEPAGKDAVDSDPGSVHSLEQEGGATSPGAQAARQARTSAAGKRAASAASQPDGPEAQPGEDAKEGHTPRIPRSVWDEAIRRGQQISKWLSSSCCVLEIYAGCARFASAVAEKGMRVFTPIDKQNGPWADTESLAVQAVLLAAIELGLVWYVHLAPECRTWSRARVRYKRPATVGPTLSFTESVLQKIHEFNCQCAQSVANPWQPRQGRKIFVSIENPFPSKLFAVPRIAQLSKQLALTPVVFDCCAWGAIYKKPTQLRTNMAALSVLAKGCKTRAPHSHETLEGKVTIMDSGKQKSVWKTSLAAKYVSRSE